MAESNKQTKKCSYCGREMREKDEICLYCGFNSKTGTMSIKEFKREKQTKEEKEPQKPAKRRIRIVLLLIILLILAFIFFTGKGSFIISYVSDAIQKITEFKSAKPKGKPDASRAQDKKISTVTKRIPAGMLVLEGISFDPNGKSWVLINNEFVSEGDVIKGVKIKKINRETVEIVIGDKEQVLEIGKSIPVPRY